MPAASRAVIAAHRFVRLCVPRSGSESALATSSPWRWTPAAEALQPSSVPNRRTSSVARGPRGPARSRPSSTHTFTPGSESRRSLSSRYLSTVSCQSRCSLSMFVTRATSGPCARSAIWKLESSSTTGSSRGASSSSRAGTPMFPASETRVPPAPAKCAISAAVVLLPLVPVAPITPSAPCSASQSPVGVAIFSPASRIAAISGR